MTGGAILVERLVCRHGGTEVLSGIGLEVDAGEFVGILGPNGSGKTTLLRAIAGLHAPASGRVLVDGEDVATLTPAALARRLAMQAQESTGALGYTVRDVVGMGRLAHRTGIFGETDADRAVVESCLETLGVAPFADRAVEALSGGERQRVMIARALAQEPAILLLDEPTNHLDIRHRFEVMSLVRSLGLTVMATLHDIEFAARLCDRIVVLGEGRIAAEGRPADALTGETIEAVWGVAASLDRHPASGEMRIDLRPLRGMR